MLEIWLSYYGLLLYGVRSFVGVGTLVINSFSELHMLEDMTGSLGG